MQSVLAVGSSLLIRLSSKMANFVVQKTIAPKNVIEQAGTELCQAQLKLASGLFCFRLAQPTALELD